MKILSVILLKKGAPGGDLTYFTGLPIEAGHIVSVPVRNKKTLALVTAASGLEKAKSDIKGMNFNLKKVADDKGPSVFLKEFLEAADDMSRYFALSKGGVVSALLPNIFIEEYDKFSKIKHKNFNHSLNIPNNLQSEKLLFQYPLADRISIYKTLVRESFARGKSVFLILPTEQDIDIFSALLSKGIEQFTFVFHSGIGAKKNLKACEKLASGTHPALVLGTAPFLSIPKADFGTIILEHESSNAYRTIKKPRLDLRTFAEIYASKIGAKFILADEMLRFETIARKDLDHLHPLYPLSFRIDFPGEIEVIRRTKNGSPKFKIFAEECLAEIKSASADEKNVFVFSLRKGLATTTVCRDCGDTLTCDQCVSPLVLYTSHQGKKRMFVCNRCERDSGADLVCARCGSWNLVPLGIGTDTVYEELKKMLPKSKIWKLDKESAKSASGAKKMMREFENEKGAILVGTEMAFFYLADKVPLAVIASFDSLWSIPNYKMSEKIIQIALKLANLTSEKIIIETKNENDPAILAIKSGNLLQFVRQELEDREKLKYPPYKRFIKISYFGDREQTAKARKFLAENFAEYDPEIFGGFVARLRGKYVTNALLKIDPSRWSLPALSPGSRIDENLYRKLASLPPIFEVAVDPEDLL